MTDAIPNDEQLRQLIGQEVLLEGQTCQIVEVLQNGPSLVLECVKGDGKIQGNQFGDGNRRVHQHHTVPVYSSIGNEQLHPVFEQIWKQFNPRR